MEKDTFSAGFIIENQVGIEELLPRGKLILRSPRTLVACSTRWKFVPFV